MKKLRRSRGRVEESRTDATLARQLPEEDVPMRSVSIASDGSALVGGNHKVRLLLPLLFSSSSSPLPSTPPLFHEQGVVYVWTIQPGLAFTDLQPKTRFQAHSRYLVKVVVSPDTKCAPPLLSLLGLLPLFRSLTDILPLPLLNLLTSLPALNPRPRPPPLSCTSTDSSPPVPPTQPSRSGPLRSLPNPPPPPPLQTQTTSTREGGSRTGRGINWIRCCRGIRGGFGIWRIRRIRRIWCRVRLALSLLSPFPPFRSTLA